MLPGTIKKVVLVPFLVVLLNERSPSYSSFSVYLYWLWELYAFGVSGGNIECTEPMREQSTGS